MYHASHVLKLVCHLSCDVTAVRKGFRPCLTYVCTYRVRTGCLLLIAGPYVYPLYTTGMYTLRLEKKHTMIINNKKKWRSSAKQETKKDETVCLDKVSKFSSSSQSRNIFIRGVLSFSSSEKILPKKNPCTLPRHFTLVQINVYWAYRSERRYVQVSGECSRSRPEQRERRPDSIKTASAVVMAQALVRRDEGEGGVCGNTRSAVRLVVPLAFTK